jgi:hypothetical protein
MDQFYRFTCAFGTPQRVFGLDQAGPAPFQKAPAVALPAGPADAVQGRAPGPARQCIIGWDTVGEVAAQAASTAKREVRVGASGRLANQAAIRSKFSAAAVAMCCRAVLASPR